MANSMTLNGLIAKHEGGTLLPYQRDVSNSTNVVLSGGYAGGGTPSAIEVSWKSASFVSLTSMTISGGNWTGTFAAQAGDEGTLNLRWTNDTAATATTYFALGDAFLIIGDSIAVGNHVNFLLSSATPKHTRYIFFSGSPPQWVDWDSTSDGPDSGSWPLLGTEITANQSVPVFFLDFASSGTTFGNWVHGQVGTFDAAMTNVGVAGLTKVRAVLLHLGVNQVHGSGNTPAAIKAAVQQTCSDLNTYLPGGAVPIIWAPVGPVDSSTGTLRTEADAVRLGMQQAVTAGYCYLGPYYEDLTFPDQLHPVNANAQDMAGRWWLAISDTLYGTSNGHGPRLSSTFCNAAQTQFTVKSDKTLSVGTLGISVWNGDGSQATVTSQTQAGNTVTAMVSPAATGAPTISFASGNDAIGAGAIKGTTEALPSGASVQRPIEIFLNQPMGTAPAQGHFGSVMRGIIRGPMR